MQELDGAQDMCEDGPRLRFADELCLKDHVVYDAKNAMYGPAADVRSNRAAPVIRDVGRKGEYRG
jgi:hypothetical protein